METLSPSTRKVVAVGLLIFAILLSIELIVTPVLSLTSASLDWLRFERVHRARSNAILARPAAPVGTPLPDGLVLTAADRGQAVHQLIGVLRALALREGGALSGIKVAGQADDPELATISFQLSAPELKIVQFVNEVERGAPLIRFNRWAIESAPAPDQPARLDAEASAVWRTP